MTQIRANKCAVVALSAVLLAAGCVRRTISDGLGLPNVPSVRRSSPDELLRSIFEQQTHGAFNPLTDDRRVQALQKRLTLNPADSIARSELAGIYETYNLFDDAFDQYVEVLRLTKDSKIADSRRLTDSALLGLARCGRAGGRANAALPFLEESPNEFRSVAFWNELGLLYDAVGDLVAGERALREGVAQNGASDSLKNNLGYNLLLQNKYEAAETELRNALELNPRSQTSRNNLGVLLARTGRVQEAFEQFRLSSDAATAHNNLAVVLLEIGKYEESRQELVKALTIRRYFAPALANFRLVQERIRDRSEASTSDGAPQKSDGVLATAGGAPPLDSDPAAKVKDGVLKVREDTK